MGNTDSTTENAIIKVALRSVGNQLLLLDGDSTSVVSPVIKLNKNQYKLSFSTDLAINPEELVKVFQKNITDYNIHPDYIAEVLSCENDEVVYSFQINATHDISNISCLGRILPSSCTYMIVTFIKPLASVSDPTETSGKSKHILPLIGLLLLTILVYFYWRIRYKASLHENNKPISTIGDFSFFPAQNKMTIADKIIQLTSKECELLQIFVSQQNEIVKREKIIKEIWEDKGILVGRSLDTFISRLRKKLKDDEDVSIVNVHGVGYKLEVIKSN